MSSLNTSLSIAMQALMAEQGAIEATSNNIANANTPGYSRVVPIFEEAEPTDVNGISIGNGVVLAGYQSVRDQVLATRIDQVTQQNSGAQAQLNSLQQVQTYFDSTGTDIGSEMSAFFSSISELETNPSSSSLRQSVLSAAQNLATAFRTTSSGITQVQTGLNQQVTSDVAQINQLTAQIAQLNSQLAQAKAGGQDGGTVQDQMNEDLSQLSTLTDVSVTQTESGITVTTGNGTALVSGSQSFNLQTSAGPGGMTQVLDSEGNNITATIQNGDLGGTLQVRDGTLPGLLNQLDTLANQFATAMNSANASGTDLDGNTGGAIFSVPSTVAGSAADITVAMTDPSQIAASSDGTTGSGGNLTNLLAVQNAQLPMGSSPTDAYSSLVFNVGEVTSNAQAEVSGTGSALTQLQDQQSAISGVSIDEESANLLQYQQAYEAAAKVVSTIDELGAVALNMGTGEGSYY